MKESIYIHNIGPLQDIRMDEIKPFTLIIGESASGKSTLMKVLAQFRYFYKIAVISSWLKNANIAGDYFEISDNEFWIRAGLDEMLSESSTVIYSVTIGKSCYRIEYKNGQLSELPIIANSDLNFFKISFISENRNVIPDWNDTGAANAGFGARLGYYFHETFFDFNKATDVVKDIPLDHLKMHLQVIKEDNKKKYLISPNDESYQPIDLKKSSSGVQTSSSLVAIPLYLATSFSFEEAVKRATFDFLFSSNRLDAFNSGLDLSKVKRYVHIHAEEAELCLFPDAQRELIDQLIKICFDSKKEDREITLMITTHSPYIINHLNVLLRRHKYHSTKVGIAPEQLGVYRIESGKLQNLMGTDLSTGETVVNTLDMSETMNDIYEEYVGLANNVISENHD